jgi:glycosyltransferase involved in cell wall biosynthesis
MKILSIPSNFGISKPINGGQNRFSNIIKIQKNLGHEVLVLEPEKFFDERDYDTGKIIIFRDLTFFKWYLSILRDINPFFFNKFFKLLLKEKIDIIEIHHFPGAILIKIIILLSGKRIPIIYNSHNAESNFISESLADDSHYSLIEKIFMKNYTKFLDFVGCKYIVDFIFAVSETDKLHFISKYDIGSKVYVLPSGCNIELLPTHSIKAAIKEHYDLDDNKILVIFHGSYSHNPNAEAINLIIDYISPIIKSKNNNILFILAGSGIPKIKTDNVISFGYIENLFDLISIADIAIVPLKRGAGTKLKIFDYFNAGLAIISTAKGMQGIDVKNGIDAILTEDVDNSFIDSIMSVICDEKLRKQLGRNARKLAEEKYNWVVIGNDLNKIYKEIFFAQKPQREKILKRD